MPGLSVLLILVGIALSVFTNADGWGLGMIIAGSILLALKLVLFGLVLWAASDDISSTRRRLR